VHPPIWYRGPAVITVRRVMSGCAAPSLAQMVVGDIGGTNSRLSLFAVDARVAAEQQSTMPLFHAAFKNAEFASFSEVMAEFLRLCAAATGAKDLRCAFFPPTPPACTLLLTLPSSLNQLLPQR